MIKTNQNHQSFLLQGKILEYDIEFELMLSRVKINANSTDWNALFEKTIEQIMKRWIATNRSQRLCKSSKKFANASLNCHYLIQCKLKGIIIMQI